MSYRLWFPQLDVYDTIRRYVALLAAWKDDAPTRERLFICDFYLSNPPLLHQTRMTSGVRDAFRQLRIVKDSDQFLRYPAPALLFNRMSGIQNEALANLVGRELVDVPMLETGHVALSVRGKALAGVKRGWTVDDAEERLIVFLATRFIEIGNEVGGLRAATGLRRIGL